MILLYSKLEGLLYIPIINYNCLVEKLEWITMDRWRSQQLKAHMHAVEKRTSAPVTECEMQQCRAVSQSISIKLPGESAPPSTYSYEA